MQTHYFGSWVEVGQTVQRTRKRRGWAVEELAARAQVPASTVENIEAAAERTDLESIFAVLDALEIFAAVLPAPENTDWTPDGIDLKQVKAQFA